MNEKNLFEIYSMETELSEQICIEKKVINNLKRMGIRKVIVKLIADRNISVYNNYPDRAEIKKIVEIQYLPEEVVEKFLKSKGSIKKSKLIQKGIDAGK